MLGCIYIYLHILKTLRVRFILFPLSDVGLKVPTSSFLENLKRLRQSLEIDVWWLTLWWWLLRLSALQRLSDSNKFSNVTTNILSSNLRPFHSFWQIFAILHSRKSATLCETRWAAAGSGAGAKAPRRPSLRKGCNAEKIAAKLRGFVSLCRGRSILHYYMSTHLCRETNFSRIPPPADSAGWSEWRHWGRSSPHLGAVFGQFLAPAHFKAWA